MVLCAIILLPTLLCIFSHKSHIFNNCRKLGSAYCSYRAIICIQLRPDSLVTDLEGCSPQDLSECLCFAEMIQYEYRWAVGQSAVVAIAKARGQSKAIHC